MSRAERQMVSGPRLAPTGQKSANIAAKAYASVRISRLGYLALNGRSLSRDHLELTVAVNVYEVDHRLSAL